MTQAIRIHQTGGPEVLRWETVTVGEPGPGELRLRHSAIGVNFIDTYHRSGLYPLPLPFTPGLEGAGEVVAVGEGVKDFSPGDRVAYVGGPPGGYAQERLIPAARVVHLPEAIDELQAASMMLRGLTVQYLFRRTYRLQPGQTILFHAAAGGVGLIACQWARALGVTMIGTVSSDEKAELARAHGCAHTIVYTRENFVERVKEITQGRGVPVVYDSVGKDTFPGSLDCLSPLGLFVSYGNASGPVPAFDMLLLAQKGSLFATRPTLMHYTGKREDLDTMSRELFELVGSGKIQIEARHRYALADAALAQRELEARRTTGSVVLLP